jgi:hypothetical protein
MQVINMTVKSLYKLGGEVAEDFAKKKDVP